MFKPPAKAGKLTAAEKKRVPKARPGLGVACASGAAGIRLTGDEIDVPRDVTPEYLEFLGERSEGIDLLIKDLEMLLEIFKQTNLLFDAEALEVVARLNKRVNESKNPAVRAAFAGVLAYFAVYGTKSKKKAAS